MNNSIDASCARFSTRIFVGILFGCLLSWPLAMVIANGSTLTGLYEEGIGYRYFYNLRQLYDPATYLFLPQGQFTDILQKGVHIALTLIGYPPEQLRPRIDLFAFASLALFYSLATAALLWLVKVSSTSVAAISNGIYWAIPAYILGGWQGFVLLQPDYPNIELAFAIFAAGYLARIEEPFIWNSKHILLIGLFLGIAAGTKITLLIFPITVLAWALLASHSSRKFLYSGIVVISGFAVWAGIMAIALDGRRSFARQYFVELWNFLHVRGGLSTGPSAMPNWPAWMFERFFSESSIIRFIYVTPIFVLLGLIGASRSTRKLVIVLVVGAIVSNLILSLRDYSITQIEAGLYLFLVFWVCATRIWWPAIVVRIPFRAVNFAAIVCGIFIFGAMLVALKGPENIVAFVERNTKNQASLREIQKIYPGRHLWLVPNNFYRPASVESAIMKGGGGSNGQWLDPPSPLMSRAFPDLEFAFFESDLSKKKIQNYSAVFFAYPLGKLDNTLALLRESYRMNFTDWLCRERVQFQGHGVAVCIPPQAVL